MNKGKRTRKLSELYIGQTCGLLHFTGDYYFDNRNHSYWLLSIHSLWLVNHIALTEEISPYLLPRYFPFVVQTHAVSAVTIWILIETIFFLCFFFFFLLFFCIIVLIQCMKLLSMFNNPFMFTWEFGKVINEFKSP